MEGSSSSTCPTATSTVKDVEKISKGNDSLLRKPEEQGDPGPTHRAFCQSAWLDPIGHRCLLPQSPQAQYSQKAISPSPAPTSPASTWKIQQRDPEDNERDRVGKYAVFRRKRNRAHPGNSKKKKKTDLKTRRLVGLKKENFEDLLRTSGVPCQYFCRRSFATWDVLMPTEEQATRVAANNIVTKFFRLQPEYMGTHRIRVTVCNVLAFITGEVLGSFLSAYGRVEEVNLLRSSAGTVYGDYMFRLCLTREGFQAIPEIITNRDRQMMVVVEGRQPRCWSCKQLGHIAKFCPQ